MAVVNQELYVLLRVVRNYSEHGSSFAHRVHPLYTWPEWVDRKLFGVIGMGSELYLVGGTMRTLSGAAAGDNETLNDVDICTIKCGTENLKWRKGASMPLSGANVQGCAVLELWGPPPTPFFFCILFVLVHNTLTQQDFDVGKYVRGGHVELPPVYEQVTTPWSDKTLLLARWPPSPAISIKCGNWESQVERRASPCLLPVWFLQGCTVLALWHTYFNFSATQQLWPDKIVLLTRWPPSQALRKRATFSPVYEEVWALDIYTIKYRTKHLKL